MQFLHGFGGSSQLEILALSDRTVREKAKTFLNGSMVYPNLNRTTVRKSKARNGIWELDLNGEIILQIPMQRINSLKN